MSRTDDIPARKRGISVLNWMGTLILAAIPGVNILSFVLFLILGRSRSKRTFAAASLILMGVFAILTVAAFMLFGAQLTDFANWLAEQSA